MPDPLPLLRIAPSGVPLSKEARMPEYRRAQGSDVWHWCTNCSQWPESDYDARFTEPMAGELDSECREKEQERDCSTE